MMTREEGEIGGMTVGMKHVNDIDNNEMTTRMKQHTQHITSQQQ